MEPSKSLKNSFILRDTGEGQEDTFHGIILAMNRSGQDVTWSFQFKKLDGLDMVGYKANPKQVDLKLGGYEYKCLLLRRKKEQRSGFHYATALKKHGDT